MKFVIAVALFCVGLAAAHEDGQWRGEGIAESQDHGQYNGQNGGNYNGGYAGGYAGAAQGSYHGPAAPLAHDGRVVDTPEVAQAKAAHYAAVNAANGGGAAHGGYNGGYNNGAYNNGGYNGAANGAYNGAAQGAYHGPAAPLAQDGRVVDTPEVAQARAAHFAAVNVASSGAGYGGAHGNNYHY